MLLNPTAIYANLHAGGFLQLDQPVPLGAVLVPSGQTVSLAWAVDRNCFVRRVSLIEHGAPFGPTRLAGMQVAGVPRRPHEEWSPGADLPKGQVAVPGGDRLLVLVGQTVEIQIDQPPGAPPDLLGYACAALMVDVVDPYARWSDEGWLGAKAPCVTCGR